MAASIRSATSRGIGIGGNDDRSARVASSASSTASASGSDSIRGRSAASVSASSTPACKSASRSTDHGGSIGVP